MHMSLNRTSPLPRPDQFESGDLVWPKKPRAFVPYRHPLDADQRRAKETWEREKREFLQRCTVGGTHLTTKQLSVLRELEYREFSMRYYGNLTPGAYVPYSSAPRLYIGHVGIVEVASNDQRFVIEAVDDGVVCRSYQDWLSRRAKEIVWLGRLKDVSRTDRARISVEAAK